MKFEGDQIDGSQLVVRQYTGDWPLDQPLVADSTVTVEAEFYVQSVSFGVNQRTGDLLRKHEIIIRDVRVKEKDERHDEGVDSS